MNKSLAKKLVKQYVNGWQENDLDEILRPLDKSCVIIESHGPTYRGHKKISQWFEFWLKEKGRVKHWKIESFYYSPKKETAFFEWDFSCQVGGKNYQILGISLVKFKKNKIALIHEYRMTQSAYNWKGKNLNPD